MRRSVRVPRLAARSRPEAVLFQASARGLAKRRAAAGARLGPRRVIENAWAASSKHGHPTLGVCRENTAVLKLQPASHQHSTYPSLLPASLSRDRCSRFQRAAKQARPAAAAARWSGGRWQVFVQRAASPCSAGCIAVFSRHNPTVAAAPHAHAGQRRGILLVLVRQRVDGICCRFLSFRSNGCIAPMFLRPRTRTPVSGGLFSPCSCPSARVGWIVVLSPATRG